MAFVQSLSMDNFFLRTPSRFHQVNHSSREHLLFSSSHIICYCRGARMIHAHPIWWQKASHYTPLLFGDWLMLNITLNTPGSQLGE